VSLQPLALVAVLRDTLAAVVACASARANTAPTDVAVDSVCAAKYAALVQRARFGENVDSPNCGWLAAYGTDIHRGTLRTLFAAAAEKDDRKVAEEAEAVLKTNFAEMTAHQFAWAAYGRLGKPDRADFHRRIGTGLFKSMVASGDAKSPDTAMKVISVEEEYFFLRAAGETVDEQSLGTCAWASM